MGNSLPTTSHSGQAATSGGTKLREQFWRQQQQYDIPAVSSKYVKKFQNESEGREQTKALHCHTNIFLYNSAKTNHVQLLAGLYCDGSIGFESLTH